MCSNEYRYQQQKSSTGEGEETPEAEGEGGDKPKKDDNKPLIDYEVIVDLVWAIIDKKNQGKNY